MSRRVTPKAHCWTKGRKAKPKVCLSEVEKPVMMIKPNAPQVWSILNKESDNIGSQDTEVNPFGHTTRRVHGPGSRISSSKRPVGDHSSDLTSIFTSRKPIYQPIVTSVALTPSDDEENLHETRNIDKKMETG